MKEETKRKISSKLKAYHACARQNSCTAARRGPKKPRRITPKLSRGVEAPPEMQGSGRTSGQKTEARLLRDLERRARELDRKYTDEARL